MGQADHAHLAAQVIADKGLGLVELIGQCAADFLFDKMISEGTPRKARRQDGCIGQPALGLLAKQQQSGIGGAQLRVRSTTVGRAAVSLRRQFPGPALLALR